MGKPKKLRKLIKAAKMGKPYAMYRIGLEYTLGKQISTDMCKAAEWIDAAAELGYELAVEWMKDYKFDDDACVQANS